MNKEIKEKWLDALRSGEYEKGKYALRRADKYCCLGVLCDLYIKEHDGARWATGVGLGNDVYYLQGFSNMLPHAVVNWAGLDSSAPVVKDRPLSMENDSSDTFDSVIKMIEEGL